jgi:hypothetical protein
MGGVTASTDRPRIDLALVIISLRGMEATKATLQSVADHCPLPEPQQTQAIFGDATASEVDPLHLAELGIAYEVIPGRAELGAALGRSAESFDRDWILMISDDIRLEQGWYEPIADVVENHPEYVVITPTVKTSEGERITGVPEEGDGVCVLVRRSALASGSFGNVLQVNESEVALVP